MFLQHCDKSLFFNLTQVFLFVILNMIPIQCFSKQLQSECHLSSDFHVIDEKSKQLSSSEQSKCPVASCLNDGGSTVT